MKRLRIRLIVQFMTIVFVSSFLSLLMSMLILYYLPMSPGDPHQMFRFSLAIREVLSPLFFVIISTAILYFASKKQVAPIIALNRATQAVASGRFDTRVAESGRADEIGQLEQSFNRMAAELQSIEVLRKDFISNVSHEFKTPLAIILGYIDLLQKDGATTEERQDYMAVIRAESERLIKLSSNILRLTKLENEHILELRAPFSLDEQLRRVVVFLEPEWSAKGIEFEIDFAPALYIGNEDMLWQVWMNLIGNAVKFSPGGGRVWLRPVSLGRSYLRGGGRPRHRHGPSHAIAHLRTVFPGRPRAYRRRERAGVGARQEDHGDARRADPRGKRAGTGLAVHGPPPVVSIVRSKRSTNPRWRQDRIVKENIWMKAHSDG